MDGKQQCLEDVLLPIGAVVEAVDSKDEHTDMYMIIGKRVLNITTKNVWDYIGVPLPNGFKRLQPKQEESDNNFYFFNHTDIVKISASSNSSKVTRDMTTKEQFLMDIVNHAKHCFMEGYKSGLEGDTIFDDGLKVDNAIIVAEIFNRHVG